jgi:hypothetical protein
MMACCTIKTLRASNIPKEVGLMKQVVVPTVALLVAVGFGASTFAQETVPPPAAPASPVVPTVPPGEVKGESSQKMDRAKKKAERKAEKQRRKAERKAQREQRKVERKARKEARGKDGGDHEKDSEKQEEAGKD